MLSFRLASTCSPRRLRKGVASPETLEVLAACHVSRKAAVSDGILPTKLYCTNANVDEENASRLKALPGESVTFRAGDNLRGGSADAKLMELAERKVSPFAEPRLASATLQGIYQYSW